MPWHDQKQHVFTPRRHELKRASGGFLLPLRSGSIPRFIRFDRAQRSFVLSMECPALRRKSTAERINYGWAESPRQAATGPAGCWPRWLTGVAEGCPIAGVVQTHQTQTGKHAAGSGGDEELATVICTSQLGGRPMPSAEPLPWQAEPNLNRTVN